MKLILYLMLSATKSFEMFPKHKGYCFISEAFN